MSDGRLWSEQRRFSLHALRDMGFGRGGSERIVREEVNFSCSPVIVLVRVYVVLKVFLISVDCSTITIESM